MKAPSELFETPFLTYFSIKHLKSLSYFGHVKNKLGVSYVDNRASRQRRVFCVLLAQKGCIIHYAKQTHAREHAHAHTRARTRAHTHTHTHTHTQARTRTHKRANTRKLTRAHAQRTRRHTRGQACKRLSAHEGTHTHIPVSTRMRARMNPHVDTYTCTHTSGHACMHPHK